MTAAAISILAPTTGHAVSRGSKGSDADAGNAAPFARLLGAEPDEAADPAAAKASTPAEDSDDTADAAATDPGQDVETPPQLPAWLLAPREPLPATPTVTAAVVAEPASASEAIKGSTMLPGLGLGLNELRALKGRPGDTPPTQAPPLPATDDPAPASGTTPGAIADRDLAAVPPTFSALPAGDATLDARQSAALDAALSRLDGGSATTAATTATPLPIAPERSVPATATATPAASEAAAASALGASLAHQTDAFGEPLSLQGHDAALRLGERLRWLTESGVQEARMQLHPRELGSVDIRIRIEGQGASVWFGADHPGARAALEATLPQLRERLASEGLQLTQTTVGSQTQQQPGSHGQQQAAGDGSAQRAMASGRRAADHGGREPGAAIAAAAPTLRAARGLVDRYA